MDGSSPETFSELVLKWADKGTRGRTARLRAPIDSTPKRTTA